MKIKTNPVKVQSEHALCTTKGCKGEFWFTGSAYTPGIGPTKYNHKCNVCGAIIELYDAYPRIVYSEKGKSK